MAERADKGRDADGGKVTAKSQRSHYDWPALRAEWAASGESISAFAARKGLTREVVQRRAQADGWKADRQRAGAKVAAGIERKAVAYRIRTEAEIDGTAHTAAQRLARTIRRLLKGADAELTLDDVPKLKVAVEALEKAHRLARVTAHLKPEPGAAVTEQRVEIVVRGLDEHGEPYEHRPDADGGPDGLSADADAGAVSS